MNEAGLEIQQGFTPRYILPAVREAGEPLDAPVVPQSYRVIYGNPPRRDSTAVRP